MDSATDQYAGGYEYACAVAYANRDGGATDGNTTPHGDTTADCNFAAHGNNTPDCNTH
ncbi:MAG: hypothetical protein Kow0077_09930 [Anaerolineae bacterium]